MLAHWQHEEESYIREEGSRYSCLTLTTLLAKKLYQKPKAWNQLWFLSCEFTSHTYNLALEWKEERGTGKQHNSHALWFSSNAVYLVVVYQTGRTEEIILWCLCFSNSLLQLLISHYCSSCQKVAFTSRAFQWLLTRLWKDGCEARPLSFPSYQFTAHIPYRAILLGRFSTESLWCRLFSFISSLVKVWRKSKTALISTVLLFVKWTEHSSSSGWVAAIKTHVSVCTT